MPSIADTYYERSCGLLARARARSPQERS